MSLEPMRPGEVLVAIDAIRDANAARSSGTAAYRADRTPTMRYHSPRFEPDSVALRSAAFRVATPVTVPSADTRLVPMVALIVSG